MAITSHKQQKLSEKDLILYDRIDTETTQTRDKTYNKQQYETPDTTGTSIFQTELYKMSYIIQPHRLRLQVAWMTCTEGFIYKYNV